MHKNSELFIDCRQCGYSKLINNYLCGFHNNYIFQTVPEHKNNNDSNTNNSNPSKRHRYE